jgi:hypothetical protein
MTDARPSPEINMSQIHFGGGMAGLIFTVGSMLIFLLGVPVLWYFFAGGAALGVGFATIFYLSRRSNRPAMTMIDLHDR